MRKFIYTDDKSNKFWNIELAGSRFTVQFGKVGTAGQTQIKEFADPAAAKKEHDKLVAEKVKKGYLESGSAPAATPTPPPAPTVPAVQAAPSAPAAKPAKGKKAPPAAAAAQPAPAPTPVPPPPAPAPVSAPVAPNVAATMERTFEFSDATSHKFWNIELRGKGFTVTYGRIGATGQKQIKDFADEAAAKKEYDKMVAEKVKKGYRETTPSAAPQPTSMREALEQALLEKPDDLATHMAYADYLTEQGDPLGDFARVQLALEDEKKTPAERKKLQKEEKKLLDTHLATWMGDLAPYLTGEEKGTGSYHEIKVEYRFARGWLDSLEVSYYNVAFTRALARTPAARLLRRLVLRENAYEEEGSFERGTDIPEECDSPQLYPLIKSPYLTNVRQFILGEISTDNPDSEQEDDEGFFNCHTQADGVAGVVKQMPRLEELRILAHRADTDQLFSLKTLNHLRYLQVYHNTSYPLGRLAKNPSLSKVTHLLFHPHAIEDEDAYIRLPGVRELVRSQGLPALQHLRLRLSDMGDKGAREIVDSGVLKRLKSLDLQHGCITDEGARILASCPDLKNLELLDLSGNALTEEGIQILNATGVPLRVSGQWRMSGDRWDDRDFLSHGDIE